MKRLMAIRTEDREYAEELTKSLNRNDDIIFQILVFTEDSAYRDYIKDNKIDVMLCDEEYLAECEKDLPEAVICGLSEVGSVNDTMTAGNLIFKYQSSDDIMKEIMQRFNAVKRVDEKTGRTEVSNKQVYCVISPVGGSFSSTFALALAQYCSLSDHTLFISFDPFFTLPGEEKDPTGKDLTDIIFYLNGMQPYLMEFIKGLTIKKGNLECINGVSHRFDLYDMSPENMHDLINAVCSDEAYTRIVIDVGVIGAASMELMLAAGKIITPYTDGAVNMRKMREWKRQLNFCGKGDLLEKTVELRIPEDEMLRGDYSFDSLLGGRLGKYIEERRNTIL